MNPANPISAQQIAIWMLEALEKEQEREPNISKCRTEDQIFREVMIKHGLKDADIKRGYQFLIGIDGLHSENGIDGRHTLPSPNGLQRLKEHVEAKESKGWTLERRLTLYSIIIALIGVVVAYFALRAK